MNEAAGAAADGQPGDPFTAATAIGMLQKQISDAPTLLHVHRDGLPDWCEPILQRALAKAPAERF